MRAACDHENGIWRLFPGARNAERAHYPDGDEDLRAHRAELPGGWLIGTNMNNDIKRKILRMAAEVAGLAFG